MCRTAGRRCEYADLLSSVRRKVRRSKAYQQAHESKQKRMIRRAENEWKNEHPDIAQEHMRTREKWQTKAKPLPSTDLKKFKKTFSAKIEIQSAQNAQEHTAQMYEDAEHAYQTMTQQEVGALRQYSMVSHEVINGVLRGNESSLREEWGEESISCNYERVSLIDSAMEKAYTPSEPRVLYRHVLVPAGISPEEYARRYWIEGERVRDDAYMSTTEDPAYIAGHIHKRSPSQYVVLQILSSQGISIQNREHEQVGDLQSFEKERLLPRGMNMRVVGHARKRLNVPEDREKMHRQFAGMYSNIKPRTVSVIQLVDENLI